jgi:hypothetical protein
VVEREVCGVRLGLGFVRGALRGATRIRSVADGGGREAGGGIQGAFSPSLLAWLVSVLKVPLVWGWRHSCQGGQGIKASAWDVGRGPGPPSTPWGPVVSFVLAHVLFLATSWIPVTNGT